MIKDVVIELVRGRIVFSCPHCLAGDVFPPETVAGISRAITALTCPRCSYMVSLNKSKIDAAIGTIMAGDPLVKNPLEQGKTEQPATAREEPPPPATPKARRGLV